MNASPKNLPVSPSDSELATFRQQIDDIDDKIIALLVERTGIVARVGEMKRKAAPGKCPIRAAREAAMVRRVMKRVENTIVPPPAAASIWRLIIGMSISVESPLSMSVFATEGESELVWMAREYFGPFTPVTLQPQIKRVIGDVMDGKAAVGIVPMLHRSDTSNWWTSLMEHGKDIPKIFARVPFLQAGKGGISALAIARIIPEDSGDDVSLLVIETDHNVSQDRLQTAFSKEKLQANWINIATLQPDTRHHLIEIKGFITPSHEGMKALTAALGPSILNVNFLGAYASPVMLTAPETKPHATHSTKA